MAAPKPVPALIALEHLHQDPVLFATQILGATPEKWQEEFLRNCAANPRVAVRSAVGVGKTACISWLCLWYLLTRSPVKILVTAPGVPQIKSAFWPEISYWAKRMAPAWRELIEITGDQIRLRAAPEENFLSARTASRDHPESLQGIHSEHPLVVVDEASGVEDDVFNALSGIFSSPKAKMVMTSNPTRLQGYFFDAFHRNKNLWVPMHVSYKDSTRSANGVLPDQIRNTHGTESYEWNVRVLGEFPTSDQQSLISRQLMLEAISREVDVIDNAPVIWGLDVARHGPDRCALAKRQGNVLLEKVLWWKGRDLMQTVAMVEDEYRNTPLVMRPEEICVDIIGMGAGVADRLKEKGLPVNGINVSESPSAKERFNRLRDELYFRAKEWFEKRDCKIANDSEMIDELASVQYRYTESGKIKVESKDDMKRRAAGRSPDLSDSFILTLQNTREGEIRQKAFFKPLDLDCSWVY